MGKVALRLSKDKLAYLPLFAALSFLGCSDAEKQATIEKLEAEKTALEQAVAEERAAVEKLGENAREETEKLKDLDMIK